MHKPAKSAQSIGTTMHKPAKSAYPYIRVDDTAPNHQEHHSPQYPSSSPTSGTSDAP
eukprot:CAMPEP_0173397868 /NCGR_PEP_ID=MMETSP1356-20130122/39722_1 /TAXON_ID=77927 ORGANISM="Hemiselmis virescens, Strain PCC157" /NCGR_SAMPLE_ID=MMETSP1356 /ASSEMBLY_ACC=CAM_ASM_000847 /LENGTH=56 /DNA_ID=CAMNT_0014357223 /DNA_START=104 /DNA_END=271 /DNA_ORIENTATION=-